MFEDDGAHITNMTQAQITSIIDFNLNDPILSLKYRPLVSYVDFIGDENIPLNPHPTFLKTHIKIGFPLENAEGEKFKNKFIDYNLQEDSVQEFYVFAH